jgi:ribosome-binding protein aMBF1 (putative translation factor)
MGNEQRLEHVNRPMTDEQRRQAVAIREGVQQEFPPSDRTERPVPPGYPQQVWEARKQRGITRYELGQIANVPSTAVRAIEQGDDVPLSQFQAVIRALNLTLELVPQSAGAP